MRGKDDLHVKLFRRSTRKSMFECLVFNMNKRQGVIRKHKYLMANKNNLYLHVDSDGNCVSKVQKFWEILISIIIHPYHSFYIKD